MRRQLGIVMLTLITTFVGFGLIIPVMPEMVQDAGAAPIHLGLLLSVYAAASFVCSPLWGALSDRIGRRPVILTGLFGFAVSFVLFGLADHRLWLMYVSRFLGGVFSGAAVSCTVAYVADITTEAERTRAMGLVGMSIGLGFILGPAVGGVLGEIGHTVPFFAATGLSLLTLLFAWRALPESLAPERRMVRAEGHLSRWAAFRGPLKYLYIIAFIVSFTLAGLEGTLQYFQMARIGASTAQIGVMFAIVGIVGALVQGGVIRRLVKPGTEGRAIGIGLVLAAVGMFLIIFTTNFWTATLYLALFGTGHALIRPCVTSLVTQRTTVGQGVASGLVSSMDSLGRILGPVVGTALYTLHATYPFLAGAVVLLAGLLCLYGFVVMDRKLVTTKAI